MPGRIYVATETFSSAYVPEVIHKGVTRVREGHLLLQMHPECFELLGEEQQVHFESTREPVAPAQVRSEPELEHTSLVSVQVPPEDDQALEDMTRAELEEVAGAYHIDSPQSFPNKAALIAAINAAQ